ncbi:MAG: protein phosphatase CheZ [Alphaproteobacteria bacterium]|nr:protein phosphatase CheZ [Alphaproteobacteria bacterium]
MRAATKAAFDKRLDEAKSQPATAVNVDEMAEIVRGIVTSMQGDITASETVVYSELDSLAKIIRNAKAEIAEIRADEIRERHLPVAQDELEAVVSAAEQATHAIMAAAEKIEATASAIGGDHADQLTEAVTGIYEACTFQDITGQRISKVVRTLRQIEEKVTALLGALGGGQPSDAAPAAKADAKPAESKAADAAAPAALDDQALLNGPQMPANAMSQDDIDAILSGNA